MNNTKYDHATSMENKKIKTIAIKHLQEVGIALVWVVIGGSSTSGATIVFEAKWIQYVYGWIGDFLGFQKIPYSLHLGFK